MASYPTMIEAVPIAQRARRKKAINVYLLIMTTFLNNEELAVLPDPKSQLYVICKAGVYQYYTQSELQTVADIEYWKLTYVGYALPEDGRVSLFIHDPSRPEKMEAYNQFVSWLDYSVQKFNAAMQPATLPEMPAASQTVGQVQPGPSWNEIRAFLIAIAAIMLFGNIAQIVIAAVK